MKLSAVINTKNAAETLEATLKSVKFADEIVVVDMQSSDQTKKIAQKFTDKIFDCEDVGYVEPARNFALEQANGEWLLLIDADETVPKSLKEHILKLINQGEDNEIDCYRIPRKNMVFAKWINGMGWWPDYQVRLFKKGVVSWPCEIHAQPQIFGNVAELPAEEKYALWHQNYTSVAQFVERLNRYTDHQAQQQAETKKFSAERLISAFFNEFFRRFFLEQGYDLGAHGISISLLQSMYELVVRLKIWDDDGFEDLNTDSETMIKALDQVNTHLKYWIADWRVNNSKGVKKWWWKVRRKMGV